MTPERVRQLLALVPDPTVSAVPQSSGHGLLELWLLVVVGAVAFAALVGLAVGARGHR